MVNLVERAVNWMWPPDEVWTAADWLAVVAIGAAIAGVIFLVIG